MSRVLDFSFNALGLQCFALVMFTIPRFRSMSLICSHVNSMGLVPKSLDMDRNSAILGLALAISISSFSAVGIFGSL